MTQPGAKVFLLIMAGGVTHDTVWLGREIVGGRKKIHMETERRGEGRKILFPNFGCAVAFWIASLRSQ
jgi:hypothetical protein